MRFVYCACCISYVLNDWSGVNVEKTVEFIKRSQVRAGVRLKHSWESVRVCVRVCTYSISVFED